MPHACQPVSEIILLFKVSIQQLWQVLPPEYMTFVHDSTAIFCTGQGFPIIKAVGVGSLQM